MTVRWTNSTGAIIEIRLEPAFIMALLQATLILASLLKPLM